MSVPNHIAIILDGNGRWAKSKGMPRNYGHVQGSKNVETVCAAAYDLGVKYLTVYAFSTENWNRPKDEVDALMKLLHNYMKTCLKTAAKNNMRVRVLGDKMGLAPDIRKRIAELEEEIVRAVRKVMADTQKGLQPEDMTIEKFADYLDTKGIPEPDLMIRTSGEQRISNFLIWQLAYTELYFTPVPWPAFGKKELEEAIAAYNQRDRRFGLVKEE